MGKTDEQYDLDNISILQGMTRITESVNNLGEKLNDVKENVSKLGLAVGDIKVDISVLRETVTGENGVTQRSTDHENRLRSLEKHKNVLYGGIALLILITSAAAALIK